MAFIFVGSKAFAAMARKRYLRHPEGFWTSDVEPPDPTDATTTEPGTPERMSVYQYRASIGLKIFSDNDPRRADYCVGTDSPANDEDEWWGWE